MDDIKREELEKEYKEDHKVRTRMVAVRMVQVLNMSVKEITRRGEQNYLIILSLIIEKIPHY